MKKTFPLLVAFSFLVLTSCSSNPKSDIPASLSVSSSTISSPLPTSTPAPVPVYKDDKVTISYTFVDSNGVHFHVQNQTDVNITIQANSISINGLSQNDIIMSDDVAPQSTGEIIAKCAVDPDISVETIGGQLRIIDFNNSFKSYTATFVNVPTAEGTSASLPEFPSSGYPLLYEDEKVSIYYVSADNSGVHFQVQNHTDVNITIQADSISLNGFSANDIVMSDDVAPRSSGEIIAKCSVNISSPIETVSGQLRIIDFNDSFKSYDASFVNIPITETSSALSSPNSDYSTDTLLTDDSYTSVTDFLTRLRALGTVKDWDSGEDIPDFKGIAFRREDSMHSTPLYIKTENDIVPLLILRVDNSNDPQDELLTIASIILSYRPQVETEDILIALNAAMDNEEQGIRLNDYNVTIFYSSEDELDTLWICDSRFIDSSRN